MPKVHIRRIDDLIDAMAAFASRRDADQATISQPEANSEESGSLDCSTNQAEADPLTSGIRSSHSAKVTFPAVHDIDALRSQSDAFQRQKDGLWLLTQRLRRVPSVEEGLVDSQSQVAGRPLGRRPKQTTRANSFDPGLPGLGLRSIETPQASNAENQPP